MRPARSLLPAALLLAALLLAAPLAAAHALPVRITPASGAVVQVPPREVVVVFSEHLDPAYSGLRVLDRDGAEVAGEAVVDPDGLTVRAPLPPDLPYGPYTIAWRALSTVDGHTTRGVSSFLFPDPAKPLDVGDLPSAQAQEEAVVGPLDGAFRALGFLGLFAAFGFPVAQLAAMGRDAPLRGWPPERRLGRAALAAAVLGAGATVLLAASQAGAAAEVGLLGALAQPGLLAGGRYGALALARAGLLFAAGFAAWQGSRLGVGARQGQVLWAAAALLAALAFLTVSLTSHTAALREAPLPAGARVASDLVHQLAAAAWVAGLVALGWVLARRSGPADPGVLAWAAIASRFSVLATVAVALAVLTGVAATLLLLRDLDALLGSFYGQLLLLKLGLVAGVLAWAGWNRFRLLPALRAAPSGDPGGALPRFLGSLRGEAALGVAVVVVAGFLTAYSPPAPEVALPEPPGVAEFTATQDGINATLLITPAPVQVGYGTFDLFLSQGGVSLADARGANLTFVPPDRTLGEVEVPTTQPHVGHFAADGAYFTLPGTWTVRASVQREGAFDLVVSFAVEVGGGAEDPA